MLKINDINNLIHCPCCGKSYKTRKNLNKHLILCELISNSKKTFNRRDDDKNNDEIEIPSLKQMFCILQELSIKYQILEEKTEKISKIVYIQKKKINIQEWLTNNCFPSITFECIEDKITLEKEDIDFLFHQKAIDLLINILKKSIDNILSLSCEREDEEKEKEDEEKERETEKEKIFPPIIALSQKINTIYIYSSINSLDQKYKSKTTKWEELSKLKLTELLYKIHKSIIKYLTNWKNSENFSDTMEDMYNKAIVKIMSISLNNEHVVGKIKNIIYEYIKKEIKPVVEYEFEF
jgi:hypothetical protein